MMNLGYLAASWPEAEDFRDLERGLEHGSRPNCVFNNQSYYCCW